MNIEKIHAREILDSRGNPTVEAIITVDGKHFIAMVPSGASTGSHESLELRDKDNRYYGKGVLKAVSNINSIISKKIKGMDCTEQGKIDQTLITLDGTEHKSKLGANSILAVSMAACKAGAYAQKIPLYLHLKNLSKSNMISMPIPMLNIINGGKHAGMEHDIQEHMIMPINFRTFAEALRAGTEIYHSLRKLIEKKFGAQGILLGDEGGFAPRVKSMDERLDLIMEAIGETGYGDKIALALDCASTEFFSGGSYQLGNKKMDSAELVDFYKQAVSKYPIISIEDGMAEDDWHGWQILNKELGSKIQLVGDDLLVTNQKRIEKAITESACNALLLKVNQIGTITESIQAANTSLKNKWNVVVSHRSGETEDTFIADLVVGLNAGQSKFGAPARSERTAKYNRLLAIEEELGPDARYASFAKGF